MEAPTIVAQVLAVGGGIVAAAFVAVVRVAVAERLSCLYGNKVAWVES